MDQQTSRNPFIAVAAEGRHSWKAYAATLLLVLLAFFAFVFAGSFFIAIALLAAGAIERLDVARLPWEAQFILGVGVYVFILGALLLGVRAFHRRRLITLVVAGPRLRWGRLLAAGGLWLALLAAGEVSTYALHPGAYTFNFDAGAFLALLPLALLLIPIQAATEELLFRGYLLQGLGRWTRRPWLALLITALLFGLLHGANPEVQAYGLGLMAVYYIGFGLFAGVITLLTNGLELAIGMHIANNLYGALLVTFPNSALPTPALFNLTQPDMPLMVALWAAAAAVFFFVLVWPAVRRPA